MSAAHPTPESVRPQWAEVKIGDDTVDGLTVTIRLGTRPEGEQTRTLGFGNPAAVSSATAGDDRTLWARGEAEFQVLMGTIFRTHVSRSPDPRRRFAAVGVAYEMALAKAHVTGAPEPRPPVLATMKGDRDREQSDPS